MENEVILSKPIEAHGEEVSKLTFIAPTVKNINKLGYPHSISVDGSAINTNTKVVSNYIAELAQIPPSSVEQLSARDWMQSLAVVMSFFA